MPIRTIGKDVSITIEADRAFSLHWGADGWQHVRDQNATPGLFGLWKVSIAMTELKPYELLNFTRRFGSDWEGVDHAIALNGPPVSQ